MVALILVPTRELAAQVTKVFNHFSSYCGNLIRVGNIARKESDDLLKARLLEKPHIVVATPGRASAMLNTSSLSLHDVIHVVVDEADLVLSYGYEEDIENIAKNIPKGVQFFLASATLRQDVNTLTHHFTTAPVVIDLNEEQESQQRMNQFVVRCAEDEKFLLLYAVFSKSTY
jgi:ATP-dependent RNA helicase DDX56/DBP9